jgi:hypothetical protein
MYNYIIADAFLSHSTGLYVVVECLGILLRIQEVEGSNLGLVNVYLEIFPAFPQYLHANAEIVP